MNKAKFGISFSFNDYAYNEINQFIECVGGVSEENNLCQRYVDFLNALLTKKVKPSTLVDIDVLNEFIKDLDNRAQIDYLEGHWDDEPHIVKGGKMFLTRCNKLKAIHHTGE